MGERHAGESLWWRPVQVATSPPPRHDIRVALCHEWTLRVAGSERAARAVADVADPDAVYTLAADAAAVRQVFGDRSVFAHRLGLSRLVRCHWTRLLPVLPLGWSSLDLRAYDVVITNAHSCVNAVRTRPDAVHLSYCHTPMRYAWCWEEEIGRVPCALRGLWPHIAWCLRQADRRWARGVTAFAANSRCGAERIAQAYGREATVVHPRVDVDWYTPAAGGGPAPSRRAFLVVGRLVAYKRADLAVRAANLAGAPLVVAAEGPERADLEAMAGPTVQFLPPPDDRGMRELYRNARALLYPGVEDFGITAVEAQACGTPVVARAAGGALDSVVDGVTGVLVDDPTPAALAEVLRDFEPGRYPVEACRANALRFGPDAFAEAMGAFLAPHLGERLRPPDRHLGLVPLG